MAHGALKRCLEHSLRCLPRAAGPLTAWPTTCASTERAGRCLVTWAAHSRGSQEPQASLLPQGLPPLGKSVCDQPRAGVLVLGCARRLSSGSGGDGKDADAAEQASPAQSAAESAGAARADRGPPESAASAAAAESGLSAAASSAAADDATAGGASQQAAASAAADGAAGAGAGAGEAADPAAAAGPSSEGAGGAGEVGAEGHAGRELEAVASGSDSGDEGWESGESGEDWSEDDFDEEGVETRLEEGAAEHEAWLKTLSPRMRRKIFLADRNAQRRLRRRVLEGDPDAGLTEEERRLRREERARGAAADERKLTSQQRRERKRRLEKRKKAQAVVARMTLGEDGRRLLGDKELQRRDLRSMRNLADPMFADQVPMAADYVDEEGVYRFDCLPWPLDDAGLERTTANSAGPSVGAWRIEAVNPKNYGMLWSYDLIGGAVPGNELNALLSEAAKTWMYRMHTEGGWSTGALAKIFRIRQQRAMAIIALKQHEADSEAAWQRQGMSMKDREKRESLSDRFQKHWRADQDMGVGERHVRLLPAFPAYEVQEVDPEDMTSEDEDAAADQDALQAEGHAEGDEWSDGDLSDAEPSSAEDEGVVDSDEDLEEWDADELEDAARSGPEEASSEEKLREWDMGRGAESEEEEEERAAAAEGEGQSEEDAAAGDSDADAEVWDEDAEDEDAEEYEEDEEGAAQSEEGDDVEYESDSDDERQRELDYWKELAGRQGHVPTEEGVPPPGPGGKIIMELVTKQKEMAEREEIIMVREFQRDLAYNMKKVGKGIDRKSRKHEAPQRPKGGYAVLVRPARRGVRYEPFVALPDGSRRALTEDEALYLGRQVPRARRRIL